MANFWYYDKNGEKQGACTVEQIKALAKKGIITPETILEAESGKTTPAGTVKGLTFSTQTLPQSTPAVPKSETQDTNISFYTVAKQMTKTQKQIDIFVWSFVGTVLTCVLLLGYFYLIAPPGGSAEQWRVVLTICGCGLLWLILSICCFTIFTIDPYTGEKYQFSSTKEKIHHNGCGLGCVAIPVLMFLGSMWGAIYVAQISKEEWKQKQHELVKEETERQKKQRERDYSSAAESYAKDVVRSRLLSPYSAQFEWFPSVRRLGEDRYYVRGHVKAPNAFGMMIRSSYIVECKRVNGKWETIQCVVD